MSFLFSLLVFLCSFLAQPPLPLLFSAPLFLPLLLAAMDHAQGRAFHHHLARAIMHLNHLAGLLPFFEPSIEWDDSMPSSHFRLERPTSRGLHTFVPSPPSSLPPTMVSHGGIPSQMILNPEPNLRPTTTHHPDHRDADRSSGSPVEPSNPTLMTDPAIDPTPGTSTIAAPPRATTRTTIPVPVRSKQRASSTDDQQPKRNKNRHLFLTPASLPPKDSVAELHFPLSPKFLQEVSTQMTPMVMQHQVLLPHMIIRTRTLLIALLPNPPPLPPQHLALLLSP